MPIRIDRALVGKEYPAFVVTAERGKIKAFARAIGDLNQNYVDDDIGGAIRSPHSEAAPTRSST